MIRRLLRLLRLGTGFASLFVATLLLGKRRHADGSTHASSHASSSQPPSSWLQPLGGRFLAGALALAVLAMIGAALVLVTGIIPIKASSGHWAITEAFLQFAKRRSISTHSLTIRVPELDDRRLVMIGAGHFDFGCRPCHGSPRLDQPRIAAHLTPRPPNLRDAIAQYDSAALFSIVKHGIKFTGMPAWPAQERDDEVWAVVAFLRRLPELDARSYATLADGSESADDDNVPIEDLLGDREPLASTLATCARCHGFTGMGRGVGAFPRLAGQRRTYLAATLQAYATGARHSGIMEPIAAALSEDEIGAVADYYAARVGLGADAVSTLRPELAVGKTIADGGLPDRRVPACAKCHGPGAHRRNPHYPRLAGQYAEYLALQLSLFKSGRRGGTSYHGIMRKVAVWLSDEEIRAVAAYYGSLSPDADRPQR